MKKKIILIVILSLSFFHIASHYNGAKAASGICGYWESAFPQCSKTETSKTCTENSQCCVGVCIKKENEINTDAQCNNVPACLQALADAREFNLIQSHKWSVNRLPNGNYITVCDNGWIGREFKVTPTPTPVPACGVSCSDNRSCQGAKDGCNTCSGGVCAPPPTPTPVFNPAACTCDGIENTAIIPGQIAMITSFAKVTGVDVNNAKVVDQKFFLAEGAETMATIIARSGPIPASVISTSPDLLRYQSQWQVNIPKLKKGATYRLWSQINCQPKQITYNYPAQAVSTNNVLGANTKSESFLDIVLNFFANLFGFSSTSTTSVSETASVPTVQPTFYPGEISTPVPTGDNGKDSLQLYTFYPASVYEKTCRFIKFRVN